MIRSDSRIPVLMYHEVSVSDESEKPIRRVHPGYFISVEQFEKQMEFLSNHNYRSLSLKSLFNDEFPAEKRVVITFDDGFIGNFQYAYPILKKYGLTATIFVVVNQISAANYLNWDQLLELNRNGISIQSHTMTHRPLQDLSVEEVFQELSSSKRIIQEKLGQEVNFLSLPHGSSHPQLFRIARELGYSGICSSKFGFVNPARIQFTVGRIPVKSSNQLKEFHKLISKNKLSILKYRLFLLLTNSISNILGLKNYARIYRLIFRIKPEC